MRTSRTAGGLANAVFGTPTWQLVGIIAALVLLVISGIAIATHRPFLPYRSSFHGGDLSKWRLLGGSWLAHDNMLDNVSGARGDKAVVGNPDWTDYVIEVDVRINSDPAGTHWGDAGIIFRVSDASVGVDAYDGYYAGIGLEDQVLFLGRSDYSWNRLTTAALGSPAKRGQWFHLRVLAKGCYFEASAWPSNPLKETRLTYFDNDCLKKSGAVGLRTFGVQASWRSFLVQRP